MGETGGRDPIQHRSARFFPLSTKTAITAGILGWNHSRYGIDQCFRPIFGHTPWKFPHRGSDPSKSNLSHLRTSCLTIIYYFCFFFKRKPKKCCKLFSWNYQNFWTSFCPMCTDLGLHGCKKGLLARQDGRLQCSGKPGRAKKRNFPKKIWKSTRFVILYSQLCIIIM